MKNSINILFIILAVGLGLGAGYLLFGSSGEEHNHQKEATSSKTEEEQVWTCSMHPQIRQNEPGTCPICGMDLEVMDGEVSSDPLVLQMSEEAIKLANVQTTVVGQATNAGKTIRLNGKVKADERRAASQVAHIPGRIEQLYVSFTGEQIYKGQKLAGIYSPPLITAQRELLEAVRMKDLNPALLEAARKKLRNWKIPVEEIKQIEESGTIKEYFTITAEQSGVVMDKKVAVGDYIQEGEVLFDIMNLSNLWVILDAYEEDLAEINVGDQISFTTPALPGQTYTTRVSFINPVIDPITRTASVRGEVNNRNGQLKPEMLVKGTISGSTQVTDVLAVPRSSVLWTGPRSVVYVKLPDREIPSYEYREVVLGDPVGDAYLVESGLEPGEEVVTNGAFSIDAAAQLNNQASMMNQMVAQSQSGEEEVTEDLPDYTKATPMEFKKQLGKVSEIYLEIKNALVETNPDKTSAATKKMGPALSEVDMTLLKGEAHMYWMEQLKALKAHSKKIAESKDIEEQRKQFEFLSQALIHAIHAFGIADETIYIQHCPMAFDDSGADWISSEKEIRNPYFGDKMLKCGVVKETIGAGEKIGEREMGSEFRRQ